jgi:hypothetical protein
MKIESPFIIIGVFLIITGILVILFGKIPIISKLPGNVVIKRDNFTFFFPITLSILISVILTIILNILLRK